MNINTHIERGRCLIICIYTCAEYTHCIALHCDSIGAHMSGNFSSCQNGTQLMENIVHLRMRRRKCARPRLGLDPQQK